MVAARCPVCRRGAASEDEAVAPFCSPRCRQIDLGQWLGEGYRIAGEPISREGGASDEESS